MASSNLSIIEDADFLAQNGIQRKILNSYLNVSFAFGIKFGEDPNGFTHRTGNVWVRDIQLSHTADRAYRLLVSMYPNALSKFCVRELASWYKAYMGLYPNDEMSINRLHLLLTAIRAGDCLVHESCATCKKDYILHQYDIRSRCGFCEAFRVNKIKSLENESCEKLTGSC